MPITLLPNEQIRLTSTLIDYNPDTGQEEPVDPSSVSGQVYKYTNNAYVLDHTFVPTETFPGSFYYDWTPTSEGKYQIDFKAVVNISVTITDSRIFHVGAINTTSTIPMEKTYSFLAELEPMYISPDEVLRYYPTGDPVEIALLINYYSKIAENLLDQHPLKEPISQETLDYILAATLCDISNIDPNFNSSIGGGSTSEEFTLGDLHVSKGSGSNSSSSSSNNATMGEKIAYAQTWCEKAALLKEQLKFSTVSIRSFVKASAWESPVRPRVNGKKFASCGCTRGRHTCNSYSNY